MWDNEQGSVCWEPRDKLSRLRQRLHLHYHYAKACIITMQIVICMIEVFLLVNLYKNPAPALFSV